MSIASEIVQLLKIPSRLENIIPSYLISLMVEAARHSQSHAAKMFGLAVSQFSKLLSSHKELALENLNRLVRRRLNRVVGKRRIVVSGSKWTVAIIIDATLHNRSSLHSENVQRFNHGDGWVIGHQWTNIVISINSEVIPLPPIPFYSEKYCRENGFKYKTEHDRILDFLVKWQWESLLPGVNANEIVVLMDAGYDNKELQTFIHFQGCDFIVSLKKTRGVFTVTQGKQSVVSLFQVTRRIGLWQTIRLGGGKKRKEFRIRALSAFLNGVPFEVEIVCSEKSNGEKRFLACSKKGVSARLITMVYRLRWQIEQLHKEIKSYLGFEDAGVEKFGSLESHVYWCYCAYLLLFELVEGNTTFERQRNVQLLIEDQKIGKLLKLNSQFDGKRAVQTHYSQVRQRLTVA